MEHFGKWEGKNVKFRRQGEGMQDIVPLLQSWTLEKLCLPTLGLHKDRPLTIKDG